MKPIEETELQAAILRVLIYYKFFKFPVQAEEVHNSLDVSSDLNAVSNALKILCANGHVDNEDGYYSLGLEKQSLLDRLEDEKRLENAKRKISRSSKIISSFPFVRTVAISGSVSKGVMKSNGDVDFFIITQQGRLWLCRTLLVLNKKIFRLNSRRYFCVNYFIGEESLSIPDENIFTANELAHLIPMYGQERFKALMTSNDWYNAYLPNHQRKKTIEALEDGNPWHKKSMEYLFGGRFGRWLDKRFQAATLKRWKKKFAHFGDEEFELAMRSERDVSKHHPSNFQLKIIDYLDQEKEILSKKTGLNI